MANMTFKASLLPSADNTYSLGSNDTNIKRWKINGFAGNPIEYIVGTQTAATGSWTGVTQDSELITGKVIAYKLPYAGSGNASLTLTFTNPTGDTTSGAIPVYLNNTRATTHYVANSVIIMVYDGANWRSTDYWNSNSRDAGYGSIALTQSDAITAITTNTTAPTAKTYNEKLTLTAGNKWVQFAGTNSSTAGADVLTVGHSLSGVTAGNYGDASNQTPSYGDTFNVPTLSVDAAGHITAISTHSVKIPASDDTDVKQRIYGSTTNVELPIPGINDSASNTATVPSIGTSYKDTYAAIPTTNIATINPSTGKITIPGGLKVGVGNSTRMPTTGITLQDTRTEDFTPGTISKGVNFFFTSQTNPVGDSWCSGIYVHGWEGSNYGAWCLTGPAGNTDVSTKPLYVRTSKSATEWGAYRKIYDTSNKPTPSEILSESDTTKFWRGDNSWSNELTDNLKVKTLTITDTNANEHLKFSCEDGYNYITIPNETTASLAFGQGANSTSTLIRLTPTTLQPERTNEINLGDTGKRWKAVYIGTADTYGSNTQPIYWNAGVPTAITYTANRLYYPSATTAFTAGTHFVSDTKIAINSTSNPSQTLYVEGQTKINNTVASSTANESGTLIVSNSDGGNTAIELWRDQNASWQLANESGILYLRNNWTSSKQNTYSQSSLIINYNTGNTAIAGSLAVGQTTRTTSYKLYINGTSYHNGNDTHAGNINPEADNTRNLGASDKRWANAYITTTHGDLDGAASLNVLKAGDTMTGALTLYGTSLYLQTANYEIGETMEGDAYGPSIWFKDKEDNTVGAIRERFYSSGTYALVAYSGDNEIRFGTKVNGDSYAYLSDPAAWRGALALDDYYVLKAGDTMTGALNFDAQNLETATTNVTSTTYSSALIRGRAQDGSLMSYIQWGRVASTDATRPNYNLTIYGTRNFTSSGTAKTNNLILYTGPNGEYDVSVSSPAAWRNALELNSNYVKKTGDTISGDFTILKTTTIAQNYPATLNFSVKQTDNNITSTGYIKVYDDLDTVTNGTNMVIQSNGNMIIGAGESPNSLYATAIKGKTANANISVGANAFEVNQTGENAIICADTAIFFATNCGTIANRCLTFINSSGYFYSVRTYGAVWNDYAEYRKDNEKEKGMQQPGRCIKENGDGTLSLTTKRLERGCEIVSDTFGFAIGQDEKNGYNTPIASSGRVLAYPYEPIEEFASHIGYAVCSGPNGTVSIMTDEEEEKYPMRAIGTISEIPSYEEWGTGKVKVDGRVWIRIR